MGTTEPDATMQERVDDLCSYLRQVALQKYPVDEYDCKITPEGDWSGEASPAPEMARKWAHQLLEASEADGLHGCRLCQG